MNIIAALDDPLLFAPLFPGPSWGAWRACLTALFGLPLSADQLALYRQHTGRQSAPTVPFTEASWVIGRRGSKSRQLSLLAVFLGCFRDYTPSLAPGEKATIAVIAADRAQARILMRYVNGLLRAVPMLAALIEEQTAETITLSNRVVIEIRTASFRSTRGYSYAAVLCDEVAFWRGDDESSANPDSEILRAIRPGLSSIPGSMLVLASSPYRRTGALWDSYQRHYGRDDSRVLIWQAETSAMNPMLPPSVIAEAYEADPESAASEYGAQFRTDLADFITRAAVESCIERGCFERPPARAAGQRYVAFVDAAGGSGSDSMTLAIACMHGVPTLSAIREIRPPFQPDNAVSEFAALMRTYGINRAQSDKYAGDWPIQAFAKSGIKLEPSAAPKSDLYHELLPLLNATRCSLLDNQRLISQLCGLERRTSRSGRDSIDHGVHGHDDVANAVAGALLLTGTRQPMRVSPRALEMSRQTGLRHAF